MNHIDATAIQTLLDTRNQLDRFTAPDTVDWHFANLTSRWTKRGLVAAGFGIRGKRGDGDYDDDSRTTIFSIAELTGAVEKRSAVRVADEETPAPAKSGGSDDVISSEKGDSVDESSVTTVKKQVLLQGINRPLFHFDLQEAVEAAIADAKTKKF